MIDVCLILEGTYPFVAGGVSTWVHQLISAMQDIRFGIISISPHADPTRIAKYPIPQNVIYLKELFLHDYNLDLKRKRRPKKKDVAIIKNFYEQAIQGKYDALADMISCFRGKQSCYEISSFLLSKDVWQGLVYYYQKYSPEMSFVDYFWTWRGIHLPLLQVMVSDIPQAKVYHSISTGYAGFLGAIAKVVYGEKFFLTEHGIYTHERMLEIAEASWIYDPERKDYRAQRELPFFKQFWVGLFNTLSGVTYHYADRIFTLYEGNKLREIIEGAKPEKIQIIPNGINVADFEKVKREKRSTPQVGLVGRIVAIKDIKTYIQAAQLVLDQIPDAQFYIIGPTDEEEDYFEECRALIEALHLEQKIKFTGRVDVKDYYQFLDLVVLTSISEAQPYVILEANVLGIPMVASDVGACREMLEGRTPDDVALGHSGIVTGVSNPEATAAAIVRLLKESVLYQACADAGKIRVARYYNEYDLLSRYLNIYEQGL